MFLIASFISVILSITDSVHNDIPILRFLNTLVHFPTLHYLYMKEVTIISCRGRCFRFFIALFDINELKKPIFRLKQQIWFLSNKHI